MIGLSFQMGRRFEIRGVARGQALRSEASFAEVNPSF